MKNILLVALLALGAYLPARAQNPIIRDVFTADPAPLVYQDTLFLYTGHDTASVQETNYKMPDWRIYSTTDMVHWKDYGTRLSVKSFAWATGDAYAAQCVYHKGKFYWFVATFQRNADPNNKVGNRGAAIGVAVSDRPTGPFKDAIGKSLISNDMTLNQKHGWDDIDPTVFINDDQQIYLYWGNGSCRWVKLKDDMTELASSITVFKPKTTSKGRGCTSAKSCITWCTPAPALSPR